MSRGPRSSSRGPRYNSTATPGRIKVLSESSSSSSSDENPSRNGSKSGSNSGSYEGNDSDDMMINEDDDDDSIGDSNGNSKSPFEGSDKGDSDNEGKGRRKRSKGSIGGIELTTTATRKDSEGNEEDEDDGIEGNGNGSQKPHKHKSDHKKDVYPEDGDKKKKRKKDKRRKRKGKRKGKKKKKKSLKRKFVKKMRNFARFALTSIRFATSVFFFALFVVSVLLMLGLALGVLNHLRNSDFEACDIDVDRVTRSIYDDLDKLSDLLTRYSRWDSTVNVLEEFEKGNRAPFEEWYTANFIWDGEWSTTQGHNLLGLYSLNHTCIYADYHPSVNFTQSSVEADVADYFLYNMSSALSAMSKASKGDKDDGRLCMVVVPQGTNRSMIICQHAVVSNTKLNDKPHGYIIMAVDLQSRLPRYTKEIFGCISIWDDPTQLTPDNEDALGSLKPAGIAQDGTWGGDTFHKHYKTDELRDVVTSSGTVRTCAEVSKFEEKNNAVGSYILFPNRLPGHSPGPLLRVDHPAAMEDYAKAPMTILTMIALVLFFVFAVVLLVYLDIVVLRRISSLSKFLDSLTKEASKERQEILETHKIYDDDVDMGNMSSKASKKDAPGGLASSRHSSNMNRGRSNSHIEDSDDSDDTSTSTSTNSTSTTSTNSTSTSTTTTNTSTTSTTSTTSSKAVSVMSSESTVTGTTTTSGSSTGTTTTSSESGDSGGNGSSSGNKHDEVLKVQKSVKTNIDSLKDDITAANISIKNERHWRRRNMHALRLMNMWCGRKDIFPGLRGKDKPATSSTPTPGAEGEENPNVIPKDEANRGYEDMSVDDMLARPIAMEFLKVHSRFEDSQENIFFLLDVTWLQELERLEEVESDPMKRAQMHDMIVSVADHIVKRYIVQGAPQEINISSESMSIVRQLSGTYSKNMFAKAIYDVKMMTSMDVLSRFKHTPAFLAMSEALDVETYDMMSAVVRKKSGNVQRRSSLNGSSNNLSSSGGGGAVSTGEIQVSAPGSERSSADIRSDAFGDSDDEEDINEFEDDDEDNDNNSITNIDKPFRNTFRLMCAIADGTHKPNTGQSSLTGSIFSSVDTGSLSDSDGNSIKSSTGKRSARGTKATAMALKDSNVSKSQSQQESQGTGSISTESDSDDNDK